MSIICPLVRYQVGLKSALLSRYKLGTPCDSLMLEYLYLICLLCLTISVPILIRGCFEIHKELPTQGTGISERIDKVADLLDEMADLINNALPNNPDLQPVAQMPTSPLMSLLSAFMPNTPSPQSYASKTQQTQREIYEVNDPQTQEAQTELSQYSNEPISSQ